MRTRNWHFCSARLQASILRSSRCPPEGGRYMRQNGVFTWALRSSLLFRLAELDRHVLQRVRDGVGGGNFVPAVVGDGVIQQLRGVGI